MASSPPPLTSLTVLEFAGLAPGPFAGKLLSDYGARVLRIDRHNTPISTDNLAEGKRSLRVNLKSPQGVALIRRLALTGDVLIDPFRPGVLERLDLGPQPLCAANPKLIYARLAGFRRDGKYKDMVGHDINYLAVSGALGLLGRAREKPYAPGNLLADFAGGGMVCAVGILLALVHRARTGRGQVVEANMVDGSAYVSAWPRFLINDERNPTWTAARGKNVLDGGAPFYDTYETRDARYMAVGALEPAFYSALLRGLGFEEGEMPDRWDRGNWEVLRGLFEARFKEKTRRAWEEVFDGSDACVTPVKTLRDLEEEGFERRPAVTLRESPGVGKSDWEGTMMKPGQRGKEALEEWFGLKEGQVWEEGKDGHVLVLVQKEGKSKL